MKITLEEVRRIAALAHLDLDAGGAQRLHAHLERILEYVDQLSRLDTAGVAPALGVTEEGEAMREDRIGETLPPGSALANAPESGAGHFKVPRVISG